MPSACEHSRVIRKISVTQAGAIKLARRYGEALVCVRYRQSRDGTIRYTTVELLVEQAPIIRRIQPTAMVALRLWRAQPELRRRIESSGGQWDPEAGVWRLPRELARQLRLMRYVIDAEC
ncbi:MAG TPA: hypothetical protein VHQ87_10265 [Rhizobacter sp.]|nr:hypothetical protein [Rhizobacter sp.]